MKIKVLGLFVAMGMIAAPAVCHGETLFTEMEQVFNYQLKYVMATDDICIGATDYYIMTYNMNNDWSDAVYITDPGFKIGGLSAKDGYLYVVTNNMSEGRRQILRSVDGENWELLFSFNSSQTGGFYENDNGDITLPLPNSANVPGILDSGTYDDPVNDYEVEFNGEKISLADTDDEYSITTSDGTKTDYGLQGYCSDNALLGETDSMEMTINGMKYYSEDGIPLLFSEKEDIKYNFQIGNKYYWVLLSSSANSHPTAHTGICVYEEDENGNLKRDNEGKGLYEYVHFDDTMTDFKYIDGVFYGEVWRGETGYWTRHWMKSVDLENWEDCDEPVSFTGKAETIALEPKHVLEQPFALETEIKLGNNIRPVSYENEELDLPERGYDVHYTGCKPYQLGEYYYTIDSYEFRLSKDGIYYVSYELPEMFRTIDTVRITEDGDDFVIQSGIYQIRAPKEAIYSKLESESAQPVYVALSDNVLAFEDRPVIENGSTLVPMRFLFEQMGADVEWNQETQTATATMNNTAVAFSINDTNAEVNGTVTTMDVPARLINDKTMVPLRFLSENMGYTVTWDEATRTAVIE